MSAFFVGAYNPLSNAGSTAATGAEVNLGFRFFVDDEELLDLLAQVGFQIDTGMVTVRRAGVVPLLSAPRAVRRRCSDAVSVCGGSLESLSFPRRFSYEFLEYMIIIKWKHVLFA